ncbi:competence/damage-inducible protein A [Sphaerotilus uruguayifluvii]|uniref:Molybdopterin-biosynthesis enzyme MoeA-like protein n=1 Tax=Sphaerotilus uruguayifluvii TaxID=2735897 RepID=A0ABX2G4W4_9BURK|nr:molybdopterin-binding protein [Leptothrix sp. C29]NRT56468.1 molybdopterin-biosynthesis enzyme MoeA-like protein [Leptothrix sp. C29]
MNFGLIIVGDEILSGKRQDKHLSKVIELLSARGLALAWSHYVGDDPRRITDILRTAFASGDVVFSCGGIGATPDDHTRQCAAAALGRPMALHPEARELIMARVRQLAVEKGWTDDPEHPDTVHRLNMGVFPEGATIIPNPYNQIPGFSVGDVHFVPGFPVMAHPMIEALLDTRYAHLHGAGAQQERSLIVYGAMEASLTPLMIDLEACFPGIKVFSLPSVDHPVHGRHIELGVKGLGEALEAAYAALKLGLVEAGARTGPEMVR